MAWTPTGSSSAVQCSGERHRRQAGEVRDGGEGRELDVAKELRDRALDRVLPADRHRGNASVGVSTTSTLSQKATTRREKA